VSATLYNGLGRYSEALAAIRRQAVDPSHRDASPRVMAELIEAAVRCGERPLAERAFERLAETTRASGTEWALGIEARSRALLGEGDAAEELYRESLETAGTHAAARATRARGSPLRRVAATRASAAGRPRAAAPSARDVHEHGGRGIRRGAASAN
jgi:hypothetical protein